MFGDWLVFIGVFIKGFVGMYVFLFMFLMLLVIGDFYILVMFGFMDFFVVDFIVEGFGYVCGDFVVVFGVFIFMIISDGFGWNFFNSWVVFYGFFVGVDGLLDDLDGDGFDNLFEFILDGDFVMVVFLVILLVKVSVGGLDYLVI